MTGSIAFPGSPGGPRCLTATALACVAVAVLFSNGVVYGSVFAWSGFELNHVLVLFVLAGAPMLLVRSITPVRATAPVVLWSAAFAIFCLLYFAAGGGVEAEVIRRRLLAPIVLVFLFCLLARSDAAIRSAQWVILFCVLGAVAINFYDITHPYALIPADSEYALVGRASGLYMNPNLSGAALIMGMILSIALLRRWLRPWFALLVLGGVAVTVSRAALLGYVLAVGSLFLFGRVLRVRDLLIMLVAACVAVWLAWQYVLPMLSESLGIDASSLASRLLFFVGEGAFEDFSYDERQYLAMRGWEQFSGSPIAGNGLGSTETWDERSSTHNVYLQLMSDFGVMGALVLPALIVAATWGIRGPWRPQVLVLGLFVLAWGLFSHTVLSEPYTLTAIAVVAAMRERSLARADVDEASVPRDTPMRPIASGHL